LQLKMKIRILHLISKSARFLSPQNMSNMAQLVNIVLSTLNFSTSFALSESLRIAFEVNDEYLQLQIIWKERYSLNCNYYDDGRFRFDLSLN
jgi:hypothetical protein